MRVCKMARDIDFWRRVARFALAAAARYFGEEAKDDERERKKKRRRTPDRNNTILKLSPRLNLRSYHRANYEVEPEKSLTWQFASCRGCLAAYLGE